MWIPRRMLVCFALVLIPALAASPPPTVQAQEDQVGAEAQRIAAQLTDRLAQPLPPHPRLFLTEQGLDAVRRRIETEPLLRRTWELIREEANDMLKQPVARRDQQVGRRLLPVSQTVLKRVTYLAFAYRMTGERPYLERAQREMLAAAQFPDWNPSHFLDVAELVTALAIGYDWLYDALPDESRVAIRDAIIAKGLTASFAEDYWWIPSIINWSQVCHGGLTLGALAIAEDEPELAHRVIDRALANIHRPMDVYGERGAYDEGPSYWAYGTTWNVLMIDGLHSALGDDFGLSQHQRFMASANYYLQAHGPTIAHFNYCDGNASAPVAPPMYWFARQLKQPHLLWIERQKLADRLERGRTGPKDDRLLPLLLVWAGAIDRIESPTQLHFVDEGRSPIAIHRSGWDDAATFVGIKAGSPNVNHGQMDVGSFVMDALGVRWAVHLDKQNYHSLEAAGITLWHRNQQSTRWAVFRISNHSHNTLVVNGELQRVSGVAPIVRSVGQGPMPHTIVDMSAVYEGQLASARRGVALLDKAVVIQDEWQAAADATEVRWAMMTRAEVEIVEPRRAVLRQDGRTLELRVLSPADAQLEIYESANPPQDFDAPNPGTRMIGFQTTAEPDQPQRLTVLLTPNPNQPAPPVKPLSDWPKN